MKRKLTAAGLALSFLPILTACGYQGWVRYECQEFENWQAEQCQKPQCVPTGTCAEDIIGEQFKPTHATKKP